MKGVSVFAFKRAADWSTRYDLSTRVTVMRISLSFHESHTHPSPLCAYAFAPFISFVCVLADTSSL